jgi:hypothetical protein
MKTTCGALARYTAEELAQELAEREDVVVVMQQPNGQLVCHQSLFPGAGPGPVLAALAKAFKRVDAI